MIKKILFGVVFGCAILCGAANLEFNKVFDTNMVLQRRVPLNFFGTANPNAEVKVFFNHKTVSVKADAKGNWEAGFPAMEAGGPFVLTAESDGKKVELKNVMTGEVWFCSGQSNMEMPLGDKFKKGWSARNCEEEVKNANYPNIRIARQRKAISRDQLRTQPDYEIKWSLCSPKTVPKFSATAYFFGRQLHRELNVPIGLIDTSWGGSEIEPYLSKEGYENAKLQKEVALIHEFYGKSPAELKAYDKKIEQEYIDKIKLWLPDFEAANREAKAKAADYSKFDFDDSAWTTKPDKFENQNVTVRWYRNAFEKTPEMKNLSFSFSCYPQMTEIFLNGTLVASYTFTTPVDQKRIYRVKIDPKLLKEGKNVFAVRMARIHSHWLQDYLNAYFKLQVENKQIKLAPWKSMDEGILNLKSFTKNPVPPEWKLVYKQTKFPTVKYNAMIAPWTKYPVRGVIWYQGCNNAGDPHYYPLMKALIADWRNQWNNPKMPFNLVQLAGFGGGFGIDDKIRPTKDPRYPLTREIQEEMLELPNVGVACAIDIGEHDNIHPSNKQDVGLRLAAEAMRTAYGSKKVSHGPRFESMKIEGDKVRVTFKPYGIGSGLTTKDGKKLGSFSLAGADGTLVWADAVIDGNTVVVSSPKVKEPKIVRYAYEPTRYDANLCNKEGFPAFPFRSDKLDYSVIK